MAFYDPDLTLEDLTWFAAEEIMQHWVSEDDVKLISAKDPMGTQWADETLADGKMPSELGYVSGRGTRFC